jgi:hypothetical protein
MDKVLTSGLFRNGVNNMMNNLEVLTMGTRLGIRKTRTTGVQSNEGLVDSS